MLDKFQKFDTQDAYTYTLYSRAAKTYYYLLDETPSSNIYFIHINNVRLLQYTNLSFLSDKPNSNIKFILSQFLTSFCKTQSFIITKNRNYYYKRIHALLIIQHTS